MSTNNYWMYVAYINKQLLDVCSMICKQTIAWRMQHDMQTNNYWAYVTCKQTIIGLIQHDK